MKISNETKIGSLTAISIVLLILGFNFLKGNKVFEHERKIYAMFNNVEGIEVSDAVVINGLPIGTVADISEADKDLQRIRVTIHLKKDVHIPKNSIASISTGLISAAKLVVIKGDATDYIQDNDTLRTVEKAGLMAQVESNINPIVTKLNGTLASLDSLVEVVGSLFDPKTKNNFSSILANLAGSSASLQKMLNVQSGVLAKSLDNVNAFTGNLAKNNDHVTRTLDNLDKTTTTLSNAKIQEAVDNLNGTMSQLKATVAKINSNNGSLGLLLNDKKLYQNLEGSSRSLNTLLDDVRLHPKRYVNISVFGRKDKTAPLTSPVSDSSAKPGNP